MNPVHFLAVAVCCLVAISIDANETLAQAELQVAILDVQQVFDADTVFKEKIEELKSRGEKISRIIDSPKERERVKNELMQFESDAYAECYQRMTKVVSRIAKKNGVRMVLRANTSSVNLKDRAEVLKRVNNSIVYHERLDLTKMVIKGMKESSDVSALTEKKSSKDHSSE